MKKMKELEGFFDWLNSFSRPEPGCDSLIEWLDLEQKAANQRGGRIVARVLTIVAWATIGLFAGLYFSLVRLVPVNQSHPTDFGMAVGSCVFLAGLATGFIVNRFAWGRQTHSLKLGRDPEAMRSIAHLRNVNGYRGLRRELGEHGVIELNEGANLFLRCRSTLTSETWTSHSNDDPWIGARNGMLRAMEAAMERLTVCVVRKRTFSEIAPILEEMRSATNEAIRITDKRSLQAGSAGRDLRSSLVRLRELAAAEEELLRISNGE